MLDNYNYVINDIPPSNNKFMGRGSRGLTMEYQKLKKQWAWDIKASVGRNKPKQALEKSIVTLTYYFKTKHERDPDNYSGKFILDGLVNAGVLVDDNFNCIELRLRGGYDKKNPRTEIQIIKV